MVSKIKEKGNKAEFIALDELKKKYEYCIRVPMSLMPFDILCVDTNKNEIIFVEIKGRKSSLSRYQLQFKALIEKLNNPKVSYIVFRVMQ